MAAVKKAPETEFIFRPGPVIILEKTIKSKLSTARFLFHRNVTSRKSNLFIQQTILFADNSKYS